MRLLLSILAVLSLTAAPAAAISIGQLDDFNDLDPAGWEYAAAGNLTVMASGGPGGPLDPFLHLMTDGVSAPGGRPVITNDDQWAGDYTAAGVDAIAGDFMNGGDVELSVRIGFEGSGGARYVSTVAITLPPDDQWYHLAFDLDPAELSK